MSVYFKPHCYVEPGRLTQNRRLFPYSSKDIVIIGFLKTTAKKVSYISFKV